MTHGRDNAIRANPLLLGKNWWLDEYMRREVHDRIWALMRQGVSKRDIARRIGISERGVTRITLGETGRPPIRCGAPRGYDPGACTARVKTEGERCRFHRSS